MTNQPHQIWPHHSLAIGNENFSILFSKQMEAFSITWLVFDICNRITFFPFSDYHTRLSKADNNQEMNPAIEKAMNALKFVAQHVKNEDNFNSVSSQVQQVTLCIHIILMAAYEFSIIVLNVFIHTFSLLMTGNMLPWCLIGYCSGYLLLHVL